MGDENGNSKLFRGLGPCPSWKTLVAYARNREIPKRDAEHIKACPICQTDLEAIKDDVVLMNDDFPFLKDFPPKSNS